MLCLLSCFLNHRFQIYSDEGPWQSLPEEQLFQVVVIEGDRPDRPLGLSESARGLTGKIWIIIEQAWAQDPNARPTFSDIVTKFMNLISQERLSSNPPGSQHTVYDWPTVPFPASHAAITETQRVKAPPPITQASFDLHAVKPQTSTSRKIPGRSVTHRRNACVNCRMVKKRCKTAQPDDGVAADKGQDDDKYPCERCILQGLEVCRSRSLPEILLYLLYSVNILL